MDYLKTKEEIVSNKIGLDTRTYCVYALISNDKIVYIGQSCYVEQRVFAHLKEKNFDSYTIVEENISKINIDEIEADYIIKFEPFYNKCIHKNKKHLTIKQLRKALSKQTKSINRVMEEKGIKWSKFDTANVELF